LTQRGAAAKLFVYSMPSEGPWRRDEESFSKARENNAKEQDAGLSEGAFNATQNPDF
jgi:hypothetical protein